MILALEVVAALLVLAFALACILTLLLWED